MSAESFYEQLSENEFRTTSATESPWDSTLQHGGPPAALLARAAERARPDDTMRIARITTDMLGGIPQGLMRVEATVVKPGRRVELIEAKLWANDRLAVTATVWRIRVSPGSTAGLEVIDDVPPRPEAQPQEFFDGVDESWGYGQAVEWRFVSGGYREKGPSRVWGRVKIPIVDDENLTPMGRLLVLADSVNGLSAQLPVAEWFSIPPTLSVTVQRPPDHEWIFLDTQTVIGPDGIGLATGRVHDEDGFVAEIAQPLLVARRS